MRVKAGGNSSNGSASGSTIAQQHGQTKTNLPGDNSRTTPPVIEVLGSKTFSANDDDGSGDEDEIIELHEIYHNLKCEDYLPL